jgi:hypothetical protein
MFGAQAGAKKNIRAQLQIHTDDALRAAWSELCGLFRQTKTCHPMHVYSSPRFQSIMDCSRQMNTYVVVDHG